MDDYRMILQMIKNAEQPLGCYGISIRLGNEGMTLGSNLITTLDDLVNLGYLCYIDTPEPHGVYSLTDAGAKYLEHL